MTLAQELRAGPEILQTLNGLNSNLREPFLFVVVGEVKSGKSSLLNALFGKEFCRVDVLPATDKIYIFKYGEEERNVNVTERLAECYRPNQFLRNFNIVDTPGTNTIVEEHQTITEQFLPMADLVLFVFSITNPWAASAWDFLNLVHKRWLKNVVFVVQQADLRTEAEVESVVRHLEQTMQSRLGVRFPVFAVSAKKAFDAKTGAEDGQRLLAESNFATLESHINQTVAREGARAEKLQSICRTAQVVLREVGEKARGTFAILQRDSERLAQLLAALEERKVQSLRQVDGFLWTFTQVYERAQKRGEELLHEKLSLGGTFKLIFRRGDWQREFQEKIEEKLQESIRRQIQNAIDLLGRDLKNVWVQTHESLQKNFSSEVKMPAAMPDFLREREDLLQRIELTLVEKSSGREIEQQIERLFGETATWLRVPAGVAAVGGAATVVAVLTQAAIVDVTGAVAGAAALFGTVVALVKRSQILARFRREMAAKREEVLAGIEDHLRHAIDVFYQELEATFQPLQNFGAAQRKIYEPILGKIAQLEETFGRVAVELGIASAPAVRRVESGKQESRR